MVILVWCSVAMSLVMECIRARQRDLVPFNPARVYVKNKGGTGCTP